MCFYSILFFIRSLSFKDQKEGKSKGEKNEEKNPILSDQEQNQLVKSLAEQFIEEMKTATTADEETKRLAPLETRFLVKKDLIKTRFSDVVGCEEVKDELISVTKQLKDPKQFVDMGVSLPKGCLLVGRSGVGKTMLARAFAGKSCTAKIQFAIAKIHCTQNPIQGQLL